MENAFVSLAVPGSSGVGAPSDISGLSASPSLIVDGPESSTGSISIEVSEDGTNFSPATSVFPIHNPPEKVLTGIVGNFARVRRIGGAGPGFVALGSLATEDNTFAVLSKIAVDTSGMGPYKTIVVAGVYDDVVVVEASNDGANYDVVATFNTKNTDLRTVYGTWSSMRLKGDSDVPTSVAVGGGTSGVPIPPVPDYLAEELGLNDTPLDAGVVVRMNLDNRYANCRADSEINCGGVVGVTNEAAVSPEIVPVTTNGRTPVPMLMAPLLSPPPAFGDQIYLSPFVFGHGTNVKPKSKGFFSVRLGIVKDASTYGSDQTVTADLNIGERLPAGPAAGYLSYGFFYNQITGVETVALGAAVPFPTAGPAGGEVAATSATVFLLPWKGVYEITWDATFNEASQLALQLDDNGSGFLTVPSGIGTSPGVNSANTKTVVIETTADNASIQLINPAGNAGTLTLTPASVGLAQTPVATLAINRIA